MLEKEYHPCTPKTSENHPVKSETVTPPLTGTSDSEQLGGVSSKFVTRCQTLHDRITDIVFSEIQKRSTLLPAYSTTRKRSIVTTLVHSELVPHVHKFLEPLLHMQDCQQETPSFTSHPQCQLI
ncbi:hypothetical protein DPMN_012622 [Dreissena polymorpha]|uniref:Uncharacterized protein n=1 Tax=Dreissena polymorpha TaxID=45954 RepID=A0A9D4S138_DREPO|nr:hypothetical protein DPMN_012622 [Dreissena polymorpha]